MRMITKKTPTKNEIPIWEQSKKSETDIWNGKLQNEWKLGNAFTTESLKGIASFKKKITTFTEFH